MFWSTTLTGTFESYAGYRTAHDAGLTSVRDLKFIDLSVPIQEPVEGELAGPLAVALAAQIEYRDHRAGAQGASQVMGCAVEDLPDGYGWATENVTLTTHAGTHLDAPYHYFPTSEGRPAKTIDEVPLRDCFGPGVVLNLTDARPGDRVGRDTVEAAVAATGRELSPGEIVLMRFDADKMFGTADYWTHYPGLDAEATTWLCEQGVRTMGTDAVGFDRDFGSIRADFDCEHDAARLWEAHRVGRDHEYFHLEKLAHLDQLPSRGFYVACFPVKIRAASASWTRVVAILGLTSSPSDVSTERNVEVGR